MKDNARDSYSVYSIARPIRTAFLLDPERSSAEQLDEIWRFNAGQWGGRLNPLIPVMDGEISPDFQSLLQRADPDIVYSYVPLSTSVLAGIRRLNPFHVAVHTDQGPSDGEWRWNVNLPAKNSLDPAYCLGLLLTPLMFHPELVVYRGYSRNPVDRLVIRNFGQYDDRVVGRALPPSLGALEVPVGAQFSDALATVSKVTPVIFPSCFDAIENGEGEGRHSHQFDYLAVVLGDDAWSWMWFWNRVWSLPSYRRASPAQLCVPPSFLSTPEGVDSLRRFITNRYWGAGGNPPEVRLQSFNASTEQLAEVVARIRPGLNAYVQPEILQRTTFPHVGQSREQSRFAPRGSHQRCYDTEPVIQIDRPLIIEPHDPNHAWMLDLLIELKEPETPYGSSRFWWALPSMGKMIDLFAAYRQGRVRQKLPSLCVQSGETEVSLHVPNSRYVFEMIYCSADYGKYSDDARPKRAAPFARIELSDKGQTFAGLVRLFPGLRQAADFVSNHFWRPLLEGLCDVGPRRDAARGELVQRLNKRGSKIRAQLAAASPRPFEWLADQVQKEARRLRDLGAFVSYDAALKRLTEERDGFFGLHPERVADGRDDYRDLQEAFSFLVRSSVFTQGLRPRCPSCGLPVWCPTGEIPARVSCRGCLQEFPLPIEPTWFYRLNALVASAIRYQGVVPVVWAAGRLLESARDSFLCQPSLSLFEKWEDSDPTAEIDLTCVIDGHLVLCEVKTRSAGFSAEDLDRLAQVVRRVRPDRTVLAAFSGATPPLEASAAALRTRLAGIPAEVVFLPADPLLNDPVFHI